MREIRQQITSTDRTVLAQSLEFVTRRAAREEERGKAAEGRAAAMLAVLGILAGLIVPLIESVAKIAGDSKWFLLAVFVASLAFLVRGLYYAIRVLGVHKEYRLKPETVFDFQALSPEDALREEIAAVIWETNQASGSNTLKLFRLNRCQRGGLCAILLFMLFGLSLIAVREAWISLPLRATYIFSAIAFAVFLSSDRLVERWGIWGLGHRRAHSAPRESGGGDAGTGG